MNPRLKRSAIIPLLLLAILAARCRSKSFVADQVGEQALAFTEKMISFGPRPPGSLNIQKVRAWIKSEMAVANFDVVEHAFTASTPLGSFDMVNLSVLIPGQKHDKELLLVAHYDSKKFDQFEFVGANDAASSVALLMALAPKIKGLELTYDVRIVFVDGEEALVDWTSQDSLYGSRDYAKSLTDISKIKAAFIVDMVGDKDLKLIRSARSDAELVKKMEKILLDTGHKDNLDAFSMMVEDDHVPFSDLGIAVLHLMDFTFGGESSPGLYWHTPQDTLDKVSASSLSIVAKVILGILPQL